MTRKTIQDSFLGGMVGMLVLAGGYLVTSWAGPAVGFDGIRSELSSHTDNHDLHPSQKRLDEKLTDLRVGQEKTDSKLEAILRALGRLEGQMKKQTTPR